jgi:uncharacterized protein
MISANLSHNGYIMTAPMLRPNMPSVNDLEGAFLPSGFGPVIDAHVHIFPDTFFAAVRKWFDENGWHIRYQLSTSQTIEFLLSHGIDHIIALQYAHKPGIARALNSYMSERCLEFAGRVTGMATVFPGEEKAEEILQDGFDKGLGGLKLHAHVQCFDMNAEYMHPLYECCRRNNKPIIMHIGREPKSTAYNCDPYELCRAEKLVPILEDFPDLKICVPHLGFSETETYRKIIEKYDNLWLDTTMVVTDYFPLQEKIDISSYRADRIMYGSDFPNIPYAWDRELKELKKANLSTKTLQQLCHKNAAVFYNLH